MKYLLGLLLLSAFPTMASTLWLKGKVPSSYKIKVQMSDGRPLVAIQSNSPKEAKLPLPLIKISENNGIHLVTVSQQ